MSEEHVTAVFGPPWVRDAMELYKAEAEGLKNALLACRRLARSMDATLPDIFDGPAWAEIEERWPWREA